MTHDEIKTAIHKELTALTEAHETVTNIECNIKYLQRLCPHSEMRVESETIPMTWPYCPTCGKTFCD